MNAVAGKILEVLKSNEGGLYFSGGELARHLHLSRTAVWKQVKKLKEAGYRIESKPSMGYRLMTSSRPFNELELTANLKTRLFGRPIIYHPRIGSTNSTAFKLAEEGHNEGTAVVADFQENGKGRMGRVWESPPGSNIYLSLILKPPFPPVKGTRITFLAASALIETIKKTVPSLYPKIKWPNDIIINGKKAAGILTEMNSEMDRINFIILGIGVNLNMTGEMFPESLKGIATSLRLESGQQIDRLKFVNILLHELEKSYDLLKRDGFEPVLNHWKQNFHYKGFKVRVEQLNGEEEEGTITGVDEEGALMIEDGNGKEVRVVSGDLKFLDQKY